MTRAAGSDELVVYGRAGDPGRGLALFKSHSRGGDFPKGARKVEIRGFPSGRIGRNGPAIWMRWVGPQDEELDQPPIFGLAAMGLSEAEVRTAADNVHRASGRIARRGLPKGLLPIAVIRLDDDRPGPLFSGALTQEWTDETGGVLSLTSLPNGEPWETAARLITLGRPARVRGSGGLAGSWPYEKDGAIEIRTWRENASVVIATSWQMHEAKLDAVVAGLRPVRGKQVDRLRAQILRYPPERLVRGLSEYGQWLATSGHDSQVMWAVAVSSFGSHGEARVAVEAQHIDHDVYVDSNMYVRWPGDHLSVSGAEVETAASPGSNPYFAAGVVDGGVDRVRLKRTDGAMMPVPLGHKMPDGTRWFATWLDGTAAVEALAYDARGRVVARESY